MRFLSLCFAIALLCLYPDVGFAQRRLPLVPFQQIPRTIPTWHNFFYNQDAANIAFRDALSIRMETQLNGQPVAVITNTSSAPLFYEGYAPSVPRVYVEEMQNGRWVPTDWDSCGTFLAFRMLLPGESRTLSLRFPIPGQRQRFWVLFANRASTRYDTFSWQVPELGFLYEPSFLTAQPPRTSLVLLTPDGV